MAINNKNIFIVSLFHYRNVLFQITLTIKKTEYSTHGSK